MSQPTKKRKLEQLYEISKELNIYQELRDVGQSTDTIVIKPPFLHYQTQRVKDWVKVCGKEDETISGWIQHRFTKKSVDNVDDSWYQKNGNVYDISFTSIGIFHSVFKTKNGCPRQSGVVPHGRGKIVLTVLNGHLAIDGIDQFSHCWIFFVFHQNTSIRNDHVKIRPPRLNGKKVGIYTCRTPHRHNPIGIALGKIVKVENNEIYLSGTDLIDGTPVVDIKPYVPYSDVPIGQVDIPEWLEKPPRPPILRENILFSDKAMENLKKHLSKLEYFSELEDIQQCILEVIESDPRPTYMRKKKSDKLYGFRLDNINVRCDFTDIDKVIIQDVELWES